MSSSASTMPRGGQEPTDSDALMSAIWLLFFPCLVTGYFSFLIRRQLIPCIVNRHVSHRAEFSTLSWVHGLYKNKNKKQFITRLCDVAIHLADLPEKGT